MTTTWDRVRWARRALKHRAQFAYQDQVLSPLVRQLHRHPDLTRTTSLLGTRRGGSTWAQEVLSSGPGVCPLFEPLYSSTYRARHGLTVPVLAAGDDDPVLEQFLADVMGGRRITPRMRRLAGFGDVARADRFVVKHVRMNLAAGWLVEHFPGSPMVVLVRHPCAVVESLQRMTWGGDTADQVLAELPEAQHRAVTALLDAQPSAVAAMAANWAVEMSALLDQTSPETAQLVVFEAASADPVGVLGPVMESAGLPRPADLVARAGAPSRSTHSGSAARDPVRAWTERMDSRVRDEVLAVVAAAGLDGYGVEPEPDLEALRERHAATR